MSGFRFPPPPPPPPTTTHLQASQNNHAGDHDGSRSKGRGRGRGRGEPRGGRGRGQHDHSHIQREALANMETANHGLGTNGSNHATTPYPQATHFQHAGPAAMNSYGSSMSSFPEPCSAHANPHPPYQPSHATGGWNPAPTTPTRSNTGYNHPRYRAGHTHDQRNGNSYNPCSLSGLSRTSEGHKRKLDALRGSHPRKIQKAGPPAAPSIPVFGAPILQPAPKVHTASPEHSQQLQTSKSQKRALGLTPGDTDPLYSSSESDNEEEDIDEERLYKALGEGLTFEHNGSIMALNNVADLADWINERKENFPTRARLPEKEERIRRVGAARQRLIAEARDALRDRLSSNARKVERPSRKPRSESELEKDRREVSQLRARFSHKESPVTRLEANGGGIRGEASLDSSEQNAAATLLRHKPFGDNAEAEVGATHTNGNIEQVAGAAETNDNAKGEDDDTAAIPAISTNSHDLVPNFQSSHICGTMLEELEQVSNDENHTQLPESDTAAADPEFPEHDGALSEGSDDETPEAITVKLAPLTTTKRKPCRFFSSTGHCRDGDACPFKHELKPQAAEALRKETRMKEVRRRDPYAPVLDEQDKGPKLSLHQRLLEQEQDQEERLALQVIKFLGKKGLFAQEVGDPA